MTFRESMIKAMTARGMFQSQAEEIMNQYMQSEESSVMQGRWNDSVDGYPPSMEGAVWIGVKHFAATWLEKNLPQAWFRPMFQYTNEELQTMIDAKKALSTKQV